MKLKIKVGELVEQISQAAITTDPKSLDQPNSKVYLRAAKKQDTGVLYYYSTNQMARTFLKSDAEVLEIGEVLVDAASLLGGLQGRDPDLVCEITVEPEVRVLIVIGRNRFQLKYYGNVERMAKEVDALPFKAEAISTIPAQLLTDFIRRTSFCMPAASNGQQRFAMDALHLKGVDGKYFGQATDGNIISLNHGAAPAEKKPDVAGLLIAQEALGPLGKLLAKRKDEEIELVSNNGNQVQELFFRMKSALFGCCLRTGKFPNISVIVEQQAPDFEITVSREELKSTLARVSNFVMAPTRYVQLLAKGETALKVWACNENSDIKDEIDSAVATGLFVSMDTWIGIDYLANVVAVMTGETITLGLSEIKSKAVIIRGDTKTDEDVLLVGSTYAISPVKPVTPSKEAKGTTPKP